MRCLAYAENGVAIRPQEHGGESTLSAWRFRPASVCRR
jgi:hypothetical protein